MFWQQAAPPGAPRRPPPRRQRAAAKHVEAIGGSGDVQRRCLPSVVTLPNREEEAERHGRGGDLGAVGGRGRPRAMVNAFVVAAAAAAADAAARGDTDDRHRRRAIVATAAAAAAAVIVRVAVASR